MAYFLHLSFLSQPKFEQNKASRHFIGRLAYLFFLVIFSLRNTLLGEPAINTNENNKIETKNLEIPSKYHIFAAT